MPKNGNDSLESQITSDSIDRRKLLSLIGATGATGIAGCLGDDDDETDDIEGIGDGDPDDDGVGADDTDTGNGDDVADDADDADVADDVGGSDTFTSYVNIPPSDAQFNPMRPQNYEGNVEALAFDVFAKYDYVSEDTDFHPVIAADWDLPEDMAEGEVVTVEISDMYTWHDGEDLTAQDIETHFIIERGFSMTIWDFISDVEAVGDYTVEFTLADAVAPDVFLLQLLDRRITMPHSIYGEWAEQFEDAETDEDTENVQEELLEFVLDEPLGNGPFEFNQVTDNEYVLQKYDDYENPYITAEDINFDGYSFRLSAGGSEVPLYIINGEIDGTPQTDPQEAQLDDFPEGHLTTHSAFVGEGVTFNTENGDEWLQNRNVRRALSHVITREHIRNALPGIPDLYTPIPVPTGIMPDMSEQVIGDQLDDFTTYAFEEPDHSTATELLEEEGFSQDGDLWQTPDGEQWTLSVKSHTAATWLTVAQSAVSDLEQFGIDVEQTQEEDSTYFGDTIPNGDYDLAACNWGGGGANLPYVNLHEHFINRPENEGYRFNPNDGQYEVPMPVGEPDGSLEMVDVQALIRELGVTTDEEEANELTTEIAWVYNQSAVHIPARVWVALGFVSTENWEFPDPEEDVDMQLDRPAYWPLRKGKHQARE